MNHHQRPWGVGLGHRNIIHRELFQHRDEIDLLEIFSENYIVRQRRLESDPDRRLLREAVDAFPCVSHGVSPSVGSVEPLNVRALRETADLLAETGISSHSEHLTFHQMDPHNLRFFMCMPFEELSIEWVVRNYEAASSVLGRDFALENVSYYFAAPDCRYDEVEFLNQILNRTGCSLLLDVTNVYNNCVNHDQDPIEYIRRLPGERIRNVHLAGGHYDNGFLKDSHSFPVPDEIWPLFEETMRVTSAETVIIERDDNFEPFDGVMRDVRRAREIFYRHRPDKPPADDVAAFSPKTGAVEPPDPESPQFADLRNFQRALLREITDDEFRFAVRLDPQPAREDFPMSDDWFARWRGCSAEQLDHLADVWKDCNRGDEENDEQFKKWEWSQWARASS